MKAGRNDPCPCGSGKKYKKCCLEKDQAAASTLGAVIPPSSSTSSSTSSVAPDRAVPVLTERHLEPAGAAAPARATEPPADPRPPDPVAERGDALWQEFESQTGEGRIAVFHKTLEDDEVIEHDLAFEMLCMLHTDAVASGGRARFSDCVGALRERQPEVFQDGAHYYLSWCLLDALAESRLDVVPSLARELAACAGRDIDVVDRAMDTLGYHGQLSALVEALRIAWPQVKTSDKIFRWAITEFAENGVSHEIFDYLEHTAAPDPDDPALLDRVRFFIEDPCLDSLREFVGDLTGNPEREWHTDDFALRRPRKRRRDDWDTEGEEPETRDQGAINLGRLLNGFVGYLRREDGVPFPRGELVRKELYRYFMRRIEGDLDPRPSMLEQALHPNLKLPKPPRPAHPLCPERVTLDVHLGGMMDMMNGQYHSAAALYQAIPAWLRFLESRRLIDASTSGKVVADLLPLHATLLEIWEQFTDDPFLHRQGQVWP